MPRNNIINNSNSFRNLNHYSLNQHTNYPQPTFHQSHPHSNGHTSLFSSNFNNFNADGISWNAHNFQNATFTHDTTLKIPTTPTRSKSLSPSLRSVNQHPRMRHKQINNTAKNTSVIEVNNLNRALNTDINNNEIKKNQTGSSSLPMTKINEPAGTSYFLHEPSRKSPIVQSIQHNERSIINDRFVNQLNNRHSTNSDLAPKKFNSNENHYSSNQDMKLSQNVILKENANYFVPIESTNNALYESRKILVNENSKDPKVTKKSIPEVKLLTNEQKTFNSQDNSSQKINQNNMQNGVNANKHVHDNTPLQNSGKETSKKIDEEKSQETKAKLKNSNKDLLNAEKVEKKNLMIEEKKEDNYNNSSEEKHNSTFRMVLDAF